MAEIKKQISIFLENQPGTLYDLLQYLDSQKINLISLNISETEKYGVVRILVKNPEDVLSGLKKMQYVASISDILIVEISHEYGSLKRVIEILSKQDINIEYLYSMAYNAKNDSAFMVISVDNPQRALNCFN